MFKSILLSLLVGCSGTQPPDTNLDTVPVAYFGGNADYRNDDNIAMLAKMRIVMIEKWEGPCWKNCIADPNSTDCLPSCDVEKYIIETHKRIKEKNQYVASIMYLNTLLDFPFYNLHGIFQRANALTRDSTTGEPIILRNDNGMNGIYVFGFDTEMGVKLYIDAIKNYTETGIIDGFFGDKWDSPAKPNNQGQWQICNHICGNVTEAQGLAWNAGKKKALEGAVNVTGVGPYFGNGVSFEGVTTNLNGHWNLDHSLFGGDPRDLISDVQAHLSNHTYTYVSSVGDQHYQTDPNDPTTLKAICVGDCLARFLLAVEKGAFLGTNGWDDSYEKPLGNPMGPATYHPAGVSSTGEATNATLTRNFSTGTYVVFTYNEKGDDGKGVIYWLGKPPPPPPPPPPPISCGSYSSTLLNDTMYYRNKVSTNQTVPNYEACCEACGSISECVVWSFLEGNDCHFFGNHSNNKPKGSAVSGKLVGRS